MAKKKKATKIPRRKYDKNGRNSYKLKSPSKYVSPTKSLPCSSVLESVLNMELYVSVSTSFKEETHHLDAQKCRTLYKEFESASSKFEFSTSDFSSTDKVTSSESFPVKSTRKRGVRFFLENAFVPVSVSKDCVLICVKSQSLQYMQPLNPEFFQYVIASMEDKSRPFTDIKIKVNIMPQDSFKNSIFTDIKQEIIPFNDKIESLCQNASSANGILERLNDKVTDSVHLNNNDSFESIGIETVEKLGCLNGSEINSWYHATESCESTVFKTVGEIGCTNIGIIDSFRQDTTEFPESTSIKTINKLASLNDEIIVSLHVDSSESLVVNSKDVESPNSQVNNSSASLTADQNDPLNQLNFKSNDKLSCFSVCKNNVSNLPPLQPAETNESSRTSYFDTESFKETPLNSSPSVSTNCGEILSWLIRKIYELRKRFIKKLEYYRDIVSLLKKAVICFITKIRSSDFRKSKRNACIQSILKKKQEEKIECFQTILSQTNNILKFFQEYWKIEIRKLAEIFDKLDSCESNTIEKSFALEMNTELNRLENIAEELLFEKDMIVLDFIQKFLTY